MSSKSSRQPEFRLQFGYPKITLCELGHPEPVAEVEFDDPAIATRLRGLGEIVSRAGGRLVAVLPEAEVWRGTLALEASSPAARRAEARARIAAELDLPAGSLAATVGPSGADGRTPAAAVRRSTLAEARTFLDQARLRPAAIQGDGAFPGFAAAPRLDAPSWSERTRAMAPAGAALAATACLALAFALTQRPATAPLPEADPVLAGIPSDAPFPALVVVAGTEPVETAASKPIIQAAKPAPLRLAHADPAPRRPALPAIVVTEGTRNMPELAGLKLGDDLSPARIAGRMGGSAALTDSLRPLLRPASVAAAGQAVAEPDLRPVLRPALRAAAKAEPTVAALAPSASPSASPARPLARPDDGPVAKAAKAEPVRVASLTSTTTDASTLAATTLAASQPPEPRPDQPVRVRPAAKPKLVHAKPARQPAPQAARVAPPAPAAAQPSTQASTQAARAWQPAPLQVVPPAPSFTAAVAPAPQIVRPAPQQVARVAPPAPPIQAAAPVQPTQAAMMRSTSADAGPQRGSYALLGVFGTSSERHALVRLPSGAVRRVHVGDTIQGAQVASVAADSVLLTGSGRDLVLKLE